MNMCNRRSISELLHKLIPLCFRRASDASFSESVCDELHGAPLESYLNADFQSGLLSLTMGFDASSKHTYFAERVR